MRPHKIRVVALMSVALLVACDSRHPVAPNVMPLEARGVPGSQELAAPSNAEATAISPSQIDVIWQDNTTNEARFEVRRTVGGTSVIVTTTAANVVSFSDGGLASGVQHCYEVRAARVLGANTVYSAFSNSACATTLLPPPPPPPSAVTNVVATASGSEAAWVTWSADNTSATQFRVERSSDAGGPWVAVVTVFSSQRNFLDYPLVDGQQVCYRVVAINAGGESPPSNVSCVTPPIAITLRGFLVDPQTIELRWNDPSAGAVSFVIYWHAFRGSMQCCPKIEGVVCDSGYYEDLSEVAQLPPNVTTYRVPLIPEDTACGMNYAYFVSGSNEVSASTGEPWSATAFLRELRGSSESPQMTALITSPREFARFAPSAVRMLRGLR